jgi:NitT/TauT family transport system ATP-binding protein
MVSGASLTFDAVGRTYPGRRGNAPVTALGPLDISIVPGEFFSIVGPSGCGKSTMLEIAAGLATPTIGRVLLDGQPLTGVPEGLGVVFQEDASFPWLTVEDNLAFPLKAKGLEHSEIKTRVTEALELVGLTAFRNALPIELSGGMRQRVCVARTLVTRPRLILLDEPFGALDSQSRLLMGDELLAIWRSTGTTILLITHALDEATLLSDRVGVMSARPGRLIDVITTGWPASRDSTIAGTPEFGAMTARIWSTLRLESLRALRPESV